MTTLFLSDAPKSVHRYYRNRVSDGAAWLDERVPNWHTRIDLSRLRLSDGNHCVLGQLAESLHKELFPEAHDYPFIELAHYGEIVATSPSVEEAHVECILKAMHLDEALTVAEAARLGFAYVNASDPMLKDLTPKLRSKLHTMPYSLHWGLLDWYWQREIAARTVNARLATANI